MVKVIIDNNGVRFGNGELLSYEQLKSLHKELGCYMRRMKWIEIANNLPDQVRWIFPKHQIASRMHKAPLVYFAVSEAMPDQIKIGSSHNIKSRITAHRNQLGTKDFRILAYAITDNYRDFEISLHRKFQQYEQNNEWFSIKPVLNWLNQFYSI